MQQQRQFRVLLLGDSCIDKYVYGEVKRLNPEAPVPILNYKRTEVREGMCWNVFNNLRSFGMEVYMRTNEEKIVKTRYIDEKSNQQILRLDEEVYINPLNCKIATEKYDAVIISDYNKGFITESAIFEIVSNSTCPVFIDTKKTIFPENNCFVKINDAEYNNLDIEYRKKLKNLIITRGSSGAEYNGVLYPGERVNVFDVVGAGDTFLAALTFAYLKCGIIEESIPFANRAAAIAVQNRGTYVLSQEDIDEICSGY